MVFLAFQKCYFTVVWFCQKQYIVGTLRPEAYAHITDRY